MTEFEIQEERLSGDQVRLSFDDSFSLLVARMVDSSWGVRRQSASGSQDLGNYHSAAEALAFAREYLRSGRDELTDALNSNT